MAERVYEIDETDELPPEGYYWFMGETVGRGEWQSCEVPHVVYVAHRVGNRWIEFAGNELTADEGEVRGTFIGPLDIPGELA